MQYFERDRVIADRLASPPSLTKPIAGSWPPKPGESVSNAPPKPSTDKRLPPNTPLGGQGVGEIREGVEGVLPGRLIAYGVDFGFTHSPTAIVQVNESDGEYWAKELFYKYGATNEEIYQAAKKCLDLDKLAVADCEDPKTIEFLQRLGWPGMRPSDKTKDSIMFGIQLLLAKKINITRDSPHLIAELNEYEWQKRPDGEPLNKPRQVFCHAIDAMRYAVSHPYSLSKLRTKS